MDRNMDNKEQFNLNLWKKDISLSLPQYMENLMGQLWLSEQIKESKLEAIKMKSKMESGDIDIMMEGLKLSNSIWEQLFLIND